MGFQVFLPLCAFFVFLRKEVQLFGNAEAQVSFVYLWDCPALVLFVTQAGRRRLRRNVDKKEKRMRLTQLDVFARCVVQFDGDPVGLAQVRQGGFLHAGERRTSCLQLEVSSAGVVVGNMERGHTQSTAHF